MKQQKKSRKTTKVVRRKWKMTIGKNKKQEIL